MKLLDKHAIAMLERVIIEIRAGELEVIKHHVDDEDSLRVEVVCVAGPKALARAGVVAAEQALADAGMMSAAVAAPPGRWREPGPSDRCSKCGVVGQLRDAGGLVWLCLACNAEATPIPTPATGG